MEYEHIEIAEHDESERERIESKQRTKNLLEAFHALPESEQIIIR
jgi:DNA-directed RNA polymerase specialized sigma subunit